MGSLALRLLFSSQRLDVFWKFGPLNRASSFTVVIFSMVRFMGRVADPTSCVQGFAWRRSIFPTRRTTQNFLPRFCIPGRSTIPRPFTSFPQSKVSKAERARGCPYYLKNYLYDQPPSVCQDIAAFACLRAVSC